MPVGEAEARNKALTANYTSYQKQNLDLQKQYLDERAKVAEAAKNKPSVTYTKHYTVGLEDRLSGGPYNYSVNINDNLSANKQESEEPKKSANPLGDLYQGTVGTVGEFLAGGMRSFYEKIGQKDIGERGAKHFEDLLGIDRKNPPVGGGSLVIGAGTSALAKASGDTARAKSEDANVAYAQKYAVEHPISFGAATAIDILPALFGAKLGKGGSVEPVAPKPSGSKFVQRAYGEPASPAIKPAETPVNNVSMVEVKPIAASKPVGGTFENSPVNLGSGLVKDIPIPATPNPFVNESVPLGAGSVRLTQIPEFKNVSINLGTSSSTGLGKVGGSSGGGGSKPSGGNGGNFIPSQSIKPGDFGFKESGTGDGTVSLVKLEEPTIVKPNPEETKVQPKSSPVESASQQSDKLRNLLGIPTVKAKPKPPATKSKPADTAALQSLINPVVQITGQKRKQKLKEETSSTQLLQVQETTSTSQQQQQAQDFAVSLAVRQTGLQEIQNRAKTKQKTSTMSGFAIPQTQTTRTIPTQGSRQGVSTIPRFDIPTLTRTVPTNPFLQVPTNRPPPPSRPPLRKPDIRDIPKIDLKLPGGNGGLGLIGLKPRSGKSDVDLLGVSNPFVPFLSIEAKPTKGSARRHGTGGMWKGLPKISEKSAGLLAPVKEKSGKKEKKRKGFGGLI